MIGPGCRLGIVLVASVACVAAPLRAGAPLPWRFGIEDTWRLINAPVDEDNAELLATLALAVSGDSAQRSLLTFLLGVLQRILPFLAAMHAGRSRRRPPTPSALTLARALSWHAGAHGLALALLAAGVAASSPALLRAAGAVGSLGALCFAGFFAVLLNRLRLAMADER